MKKLNTIELESLQKHLGILSEIKLHLGDLELKKYDLQLQAGSVLNDFKSVQVDLEKKYGAVSINTTTGEIMELDEDNE